MSTPASQLPATGASLSDILTAIQNLVVAVNNAALAYRQVNGISTTEAITVPTVIKTTPGRVASVSILVAGSAPGTIYDASQLNITTAPLFVIPNFVGVASINLPTDTGILVVPGGGGQSLTVSWS